MYRKTIILFISLLLLTTGCRHHIDKRLVMIHQLADLAPTEALDSLGTIDYVGLTNADRHFYDLLSIKAADKAYVTHASDSLILDVIDYYSAHKATGLYPEALYYGGRVYRDLGDYPTALRYFQDALDALAVDEFKLRGYIVSQLGGLLNQIRLYKQAIPYIEESIKIDSLINDTLGLVYDHKLIGAIYMHKTEYDSANIHFSEALKLSGKLKPQDQALVKVYLAASQYCMGHIDTALYLVRGLPEICRPRDKAFSLAYASRIYLQAGVLDTALMYAHELAHDNRSTNRKTGFQLLLSPELSTLVPLDSLRDYVAGFRTSMEEDLNKNERTESLIQNSYYNYNKHLKEKEILKASNEKTKLILFITLFSVAVLCAIILFLKYANIRQAVRLRDTLNLVSNISSELSKLQGENTLKCCPANLSETDLKRQLLERLDYIENSEVTISIPEKILMSDLYKKLSNRIEQSKGIPNESPIWRDLENLILEHSPNFRQQLLKLTNGKLSRSDIQISILVRYGISPSDMATLLNITPGAISSRRINLGKKIFGRNLGTKTIDFIIHSL